MNFRNLLVIFPALLTFFSTSAGADTQVIPNAPSVEENSEQRINFSGKLRMLSQRIPSAACHLMQGIDEQASLQLLSAAHVEFEKILSGLEFGDSDLNIQMPETNRKTLLHIHELREKWEPMREAANRISAGTGNDADLNYILENNTDVLGAAVRLVSRLVKQYSNPNAVPFSSLLLVDISGRQRMLTQKMSKESCMLNNTDPAPDTVAHLQGTMQIFEASLNALRFGYSELGLRPPPTPEISEGLEVVEANWLDVKPALLDIAAGTDLPQEMKMQKFQKLNVTMANMNTVVGMYAEAAAPKF